MTSFTGTLIVTVSSEASAKRIYSSGPSITNRPLLKTLAIRTCWVMVFSWFRHERYWALP